MIWIIFGIAIILVLFLLILKTKTHGESKISVYTYLKKETLFSPAERSFLGVLTQAIGEEVQIFGKVRVADVILPQKGMSKAEWQKAFNKISGKHFDFILCNKDDLSIICAIELDDSSHQSKNRQKRDLFLEGACKSSSVPLVQVQAKSSYNINEIKELFSSYLSSDLIDVSIKEVSANLNAVKEELPLVEEEGQVCPKCSSPLVKRLAKKGDNAGNNFLACSAFPKCRYTEAIKV